MATGSLFQRNANCVSNIAISNHGDENTQDHCSDDEPQAYRARDAIEQELEKEVNQRLEHHLQRESKCLTNNVSAILASRRAVQVDEGDHILAPRRIFHKLEMETDSHPFSSACGSLGID